MACTSTPCGTRTRNLRIRSSTPCPLGQGGCDSHPGLHNQKHITHSPRIPELGRTGAPYAADEDHVFADLTIVKTTHDESTQVMPPIVNSLFLGSK